MKRSALALFAAATFFFGASVPFAAAGSNLIPSSPDFAATAPATSATAAAGGVVARWDSSPWVPVAVVLATLAASPIIRRNFAK